MTKFAMALLVLIASNAARAEWIQIATTYNPTMYADLTTLHRSGEIATMWALIDFKKRPFDGDNLPYLSLKMKVEYNCATTRFRYLDMASYTGHMATGRTQWTSAGPGQWQAATREGVQYPLWEAACKNAEPPSSPPQKSARRN
jgi:hypothetical protein